jgi:ABC-type Fe3+/spermidine/putrescine transport system ATPase subunit
LRLGNAIDLPAATLDQPVGTKVDVIIRQEAIRLLNGTSAPDGLQGTVALRSFSGARVQYVVRLSGGVELVAETASHGPNAALAQDTPVTLMIDTDSVFAMPYGESGA